MKLQKATCHLAAILVLFSGVAMAQEHDSEWQKHHQRRDEVNTRLHHQDERINHDVKNGTMSRNEAHQLHEKDKNIRHEERTDAAANHGHITKYEQDQLNHQENNVSQQINHP